MNTSININGKDYKLLVTLGFWKNLSFPKSEWNCLYTNAKRLDEALKLAVYYGNKKEYNWKCPNDMKEVISDDDFDNIDADPIQLISDAVYEYLPEEMKKKADELKDGLLENVKKK